MATVASGARVRASELPGWGRPLRVGVLVDLALAADAGGHVKIWQRLAEAAAHRAGDLDLTVHFSGAREEQRAVADNVRYLIHRPRFSSARLAPLIGYVPAHTDLASFHPGVAARLLGYDVLHTTDGCFAFARTAAQVARRRGLPLVNSMHTDNAGYAELFTAQLVGSLVGSGRVGRLLLDRLRVAERAGAAMRRRLTQHQRQCAFVLASKPSDAAVIARQLPAARVGLLRRGLDHHHFHPALADRRWLERGLGVPPGRIVVLLVGRLDRSKNVRVLADALRALAAAGAPVQLVAAGEGPERAYLSEQLGERATCLGALDSDRLARLYASADLFALPSVLDETSNATLEALASGLAVAVSEHSGRLVVDGESGVVVRGGDVAAWTAALRPLVEDGALRARLGRAARLYATTHVPSWSDVLAEDLWPFWERAAAERR
jgi:glycosyltransferase involved in cell wall biosynthesis